jgi:uncharacterized repeat protein (TIGR03803 family)
MKPTNLLWLACAVAIQTVASAQAPASEIVLHNFPGPDDGNPSARVIQDSAGNFYGTTYYGGTAKAGVVYRLDTTGHYTVLYNFMGGADGYYPYAGVIQDSAGNLYGTTISGGTAGWGTVYKLDPTGHETVLHSFTGGADGSGPYAGVIGDSAGNLYGTTEVGGTANQGVVYKLDSAGHETVLYSFMGGADGSEPFAGVIGDSAGNLYGTTRSGGTGGIGVVYKLDPTGHEMVLHSFIGADGNYPAAGVIRDSAGNLYGTTEYGGTEGFGVVYKLDSTGHETVLHSFPGGADGAVPSGGVIRDSAGNLYGTTQQGGSAWGYGVVYKLDSSGQETVLHSFSGTDGGGVPIAGLILGPGGNLFGTTYDYGKYGGGVLFAIKP